MGRIVRESLAEIADRRPFLDSEHGPIHGFKDRKITLPEPFDDEYFRHMQWAHLASGGAGGGMRWPNRNPHVLTRGMRAAQRALADFMPLIDWLAFDRDECERTPRAGRTTMAGSVGPDRLARFGCASADQAVVYLLRRDTLTPEGRLDPEAVPLERASSRRPGPPPRPLSPDGLGHARGRDRSNRPMSTSAGALGAEVGPLATDLALAIRRIG